MVEMARKNTTINSGFKKDETQPPFVRLIRNIIVNKETHCFEWQGALNKGYSWFNTGEKSVNGYKWLYEFIFGKVKEGYQLDHLCRNRKCVNPYHLEQVTSRENSLRGNSLAAQRARQKFCLRGHEFTKSNTYITKKGQRRCLQCHAFRERRRKEKLKSA